MPLIYADLRALKWRDKGFFIFIPQCVSIV